ncbi:MAG: type I restriction enzyme HsdR N-terminal domain-containing protein [Clostridia bacterium]|nr:type I restriction enzyme HsdR N-terminal domain-containing protein [Clostridia bacterium]
MYSEAPFQQAIDYVRALKVKNYIVTDGDYCECYCYDDKKDQFVKMDWIPGKDD